MHASPAIHRAIMCVDIESYGDRLRSNVHQVAVRAGLYQTLLKAFVRSGLSWDETYHEDRGDGVLILIKPDVPKSRLVKEFPRELTAALDEHNQAHHRAAWIRLRVALDAGEVHSDPHGVAGSAINMAFRLVEADALKSALRSSPGNLALITSERFYEEVVRHEPESHPESHQRVLVSAKETRATGWIWLPDSPSSPRVGRWAFPTSQDRKLWQRRHTTAQGVAPSGVPGPVGLRELGSYRLVEQLGGGGATYLGEDAEGRKAVIKVLRPSVAGNRTARRRLAREVDAMRQVHSPHVAEILDVGLITGEQRPYIVTRYVPGRKLEQVVQDNGPLHGRALKQVAVGLAGALSAIHGAGIVHRDLNPRNVILADGEPVVTDFGIAQTTDAATRLTATRTWVGTLGFVAPEIIEGRDVGTPSDIYAWAATVAFAATGQPPVDSNTDVTIVYKIVQGQPDLAGVPDALLPLVQAAMARNPASRPTAVELLRLARRINLDAVITDHQAVSDSQPKSQGDPPAFVPAQDPPPPEVWKPWRAFTDGLGGTLDLFGGIRRSPEPLPTFESTLADDLHGLCLTLGLIPEPDHEDRPDA